MERGPGQGRSRRNSAFGYGAFKSFLNYAAASLRFREFGFGQVKPGADEFHEDSGIGVICEKFRKGISEGNGDDLFRGGQIWPNGPYLGTEELPDKRELGRGEYPTRKILLDNECFTRITSARKFCTRLLSRVRE
jgi:hypothetical protein